MTLLLLATVLQIVSSEATRANPEWRSVVDALAAKHSDVSVSIATVSALTNAQRVLRTERPRYVAFVARPEELEESSIRQLHCLVRQVDDDPFDDAIWGIVTGPTAAAAKRVACSRGPQPFMSVLATTGVDTNMVPGRVTVLQDHTPPPDIVRDTSSVFVEGWNADPDLLLTSSHATEENLEMPFSRGMIQSVNGCFEATCGLAMREPQREKVWIAAGNCLIGNPKSKSSMVMTALGWGKCSQFFGYTIETWFGEIGWNTWRYFNAYRMPLNLSWYAANQNLVRTLSDDKLTPRDRAGKEWDMDGTAFYGDPMQAIALPSREELPEWLPDSLPILQVYERGSRREPFPPDWEVFEADDFALITRWSFSGAQHQVGGKNAEKWGKLPEEIAKEWVKPDQVIDEEHDDWRPFFTEKFAPIVKDCKTRTEAVQKINAVIWDLLDVHYSAARDKANQSPFHSMRIHKASCTGMAILQICAYRSVGIPARLVGCCWTTIPGNHSWAEFWDNGWHHFGDGNPSPIDDSWVGPFAAEADATDPMCRIYASRSTPNAERTRFWRSWGEPGFSDVWADDVTASYRRFKKKGVSLKDVPTNTNYRAVLH